MTKTILFVFGTRCTIIGIPAFDLMHFHAAYRRSLIMNQLLDLA